ncbi:MAG: hypothetical protein AYK22_08560 [Thermoplasmatales archaeon SG8-52-3]|nr:MAG: hypothetical protein AYK22_08560 [Thermoplasmatales archaeon SG8-52-3]
MKDINIILNFEKELLDYAGDILNEFNLDALVDIRLKDDFENILFNYIRKRIFSKNDAIFIAEFDGVVIGHMIISIKKNFPIFKMEYYGRINTVFIKKEFRDKNISSKLKDEAIKWFKQKGINRVSLNVDPNNKRAINAYNKWGLSLSLFEMRMNI